MSSKFKKIPAQLREQYFAGLIPGWYIKNQRHFQNSLMDYTCLKKSEGSPESCFRSLHQHNEWEDGPAQICGQKCTYLQMCTFCLKKTVG